MLSFLFFLERSWKMKIEESKLYFIKDEFIEKYNYKYNIMQNKDLTFSNIKNFYQDILKEI